MPCFWTKCFGPRAMNAGPCDPAFVTRGPKLSRSDLGDVLGRRALLALHDVELYPVAFGQRLEAVALDRGVMDEAVLAAAVRGDETEALRIIEPLDDALGTHHCTRLVKNGVDRSAATPYIPTAGTKKDPARSQVLFSDRWNRHERCAESRRKRRITTDLGQLWLLGLIDVVADDRTQDAADDTTHDRTLHAAAGGPADDRARGRADSRVPFGVLDHRWGGRRSRGDIATTRRADPCSTPRAGRRATSRGRPAAAGATRARRRRTRSTRRAAEVRRGCARCRCIARFQRRDRIGPVRRHLVGQAEIIAQRRICRRTLVISIARGRQHHGGRED